MDFHSYEHQASPQLPSSIPISILPSHILQKVVAIVAKCSPGQEKSTVSPHMDRKIKQGHYVPGRKADKAQYRWAVSGHGIDQTSEFWIDVDQADDMILGKDDCSLVTRALLLHQDPEVASFRSTGDMVDPAIIEAHDRRVQQQIADLRRRRHEAHVRLMDEKAKQGTANAASNAAPDTTVKNVTNVTVSAETNATNNVATGMTNASNPSQMSDSSGQNMQISDDVA